MSDKRTDDRVGNRETPGWGNERIIRRDDRYPRKKRRFFGEKDDRRERLLRTTGETAKKQRMISEPAGERAEIQRMTSDPTGETAKIQRVTSDRIGETAKAAEMTLEPAGDRGPKKTERAIPKPAGRTGPKKTEKVILEPAGERGPKKTERVIPKPAGRMAPRKSGEAGPKTKEKHISRAAGKKAVLKMIAKPADTAAREFRMRALLLLLSFLIPAVVMLICMIVFEVQPFGHKSLIIIDGLHQYMPFFSILYDKLKGGGSFFYTWRAGLGINFMSLMAYYLISPLNLLIVFFSRAQLNQALSMVLALKIALSGLSMGICCNAKSRKPNPFIPAAAAAYALNSFMVGYSWNVMWLDSIMVLPLILLGIDRLAEKNDGRLYCISLFYALLCNYYIGYMICIFCVIWFFMQNFEGIRHYLRKGLSFSVYSLLAGGMAALVLLPAFLGIRQTASGSGVDFPDYKMLTTLPNLLNRQIAISAPITHDNSFDGNANLYIGIFALVMLFLYILNRNIKTGIKIRRILVIAFMYLSFADIRLNFIWHGFHDQYGIPNRFSFLLGFLLIMMAFEVTEQLEAVRLWHIPVAAVCCLLIVFCGRTLGADPLEDNIYIAVMLLVICYSFLLLCISLFNRNEKVRVEKPAEDKEGTVTDRAESSTKPKEGALGRILSIFSVRKFRANPMYRTALSVILTVLVVVEISASAVLGFYENGQIKVPKFFRYTDEMEETIRKVDDGTFYRSEVVNALMLDEAIYYPMKTVGLFGSTALERMVKVMDQLGFSTGANEYKYVGENPLTEYLLGVRYHYYRHDDKILTGFRYRATTGDINVFENPLKMSAGYLVHETIQDFFDYSSAYPFRSMNRLVEDGFNESYLFIDQEIPEPTTEGCTVEPTGSDGEYRFRFETEADDNIVFNIPVREGAENLCFYYDGTQVAEADLSLNGRRVLQDDLDGKMVELGGIDENTWLTVSMRLKGEEDTGIVRLSIADMDAEVLNRIAEEQKESGFTVTHFTDNSLEGKALVRGDETGRNLLFLSVPYDEGWTMKVDGKKVKPEIIGDAFLGVRLEDGSHDISLSYVSPGFRAGVIISLVSAVVFILLTASGILLDRPAEESREEGSAAADREDRTGQEGREGGPTAADREGI